MVLKSLHIARASSVAVSTSSRILNSHEPSPRHFLQSLTGCLTFVSSPGFPWSTRCRFRTRDAGWRMGPRKQSANQKPVLSSLALLLAQLRGKRTTHNAALLPTSRQHRFTNRPCSGRFVLCRTLCCSDRFIVLFSPPSDACCMNLT